MYTDETDIRERAHKYMRLCDTLFRSADESRGRWEKCVSMTFPELLDAAEQCEGKGSRPPVCHRARQGILKLASAHMTFITPMGDRWFQFESWNRPNSQSQGWVDEFDWYMQSTEIAQRELERSNFYTELIGTYIDRCATGTGLMLCESEGDSYLTFTHIPAGTYGLAENNLHEVDTVARKFNMTPAQIFDEFGEDNMNEALLKAYQADESRYTENRLIYHLVEPDREYSGNAEIDGGRYPWRSVYIDVASSHILLEAGYFEFPYVATRFIRYGNQVYGDSALSGLEKTMLDLEKIKDALKISAQRKAVPSVLVSAELAGQIDLSAGGKTIISQSDHNIGVPREWATAGDLREIIEYAGMLNEQIDDATFVSMLQTISSVDRQMTAREVSARESEKIMTFTQSFTQNSSDFKPLMTRIFCLLFRMGKFGSENMPEDLVEIKRDIYTGEPEIHRVLPPKVTYIGRMAQSLQYAQQAGLSNTIMELIEYANLTKNPDFLLPLNPALISRYKINAAGVPHMCTYSPAQVRKTQKKMQDAQEAMQSAALAEQASVANRNDAQAEAAMRR